MPLNELAAISGISGSGKFSLAFSVLCAEGSSRCLKELLTFKCWYEHPGRISARYLKKVHRKNQTESYKKASEMKRPSKIALGSCDFRD